MKHEVPDNVKEHILAMHQEGKKAREIRRVIKESYQLEIPNHVYYYIIGKRNKTVKPAEGPKGEQDPKAIEAEIVAMISSLKDHYMGSLMRIREQLIKAVAELKEKGQR